MHPRRLLSTVLVGLTATCVLGALATPAAASSTTGWRWSPSPARSVNSMVTGLAAPSAVSFSSLSGDVGGAYARRSYQGSPGTPPATYAQSVAGRDPSMGIHESIVSFKSDPVATARGSYDSQLISLAKSSPPGTAWAYWHEPEGNNDMPGATDGQRADAFTTAARHVALVMKAANPRIQVGVIFTISLWWQSAGHDPERWLSTAGPYGSRTPLPIDWIGLDGYNSYGIDGRPWASGSSIFAQSISWLHTNRPRWSVQVTETGSTRDPGSPGRRAAWITDTWSYLASQGVTSTVYWSAGAYALSADVAALSSLHSANQTCQAPGQPRSRLVPSRLPRYTPVTGRLWHRPINHR